MVPGGALHRPLQSAPGVSWAPGPAVGYVGGDSCTAFRDIPAARLLGRVTGAHRLCMAPAVHSLPQLPLFEQSLLPAHVVDEHHHGGLIPPVHVYALPGHELGGGGLLHREGRVFRAADVLPSYYNGFLFENGYEMARVWKGALFDTPAEIVTVHEPLAVAVHPNLVYGHFLLEMLPRLVLLSKLRESGVGFRLALHTQASAWVREIVGWFFADRDIVWYDMHGQRLRCPYFIVPGMMQREHRFHPDMNGCVARVSRLCLPRESAPGPRKIWLSRRGHDGKHGMTDASQAQAEEIAAALGYTIIDPRAMTVAAQVALMAAATHIAGVYGSAMHNALFAPPGTRVFCINRVNWYQSGIGALRGQTMAFLPPRDGRFRESDVQGTPAAYFEIDEARFRRALAAFDAWDSTAPEAAAF